MAKKPMEQHLAEYLLNCARGPWMRQHAKACFRIWREKYGKVVADRAKAIVKDRFEG